MHCVDKCDHTCYARKEGECRLFIGDYIQEFFHLQSASVIVGTFVGWLMNFPALPNCVSMFHSSTSGSNTMSLTLHDLVFPIA